MVEISVEISAAAYEWFDQIVEGFGGSFDSVQDYLSCVLENIYREATSGAREGGADYADSDNDINKNGCSRNGAVL